MRIVDIARDVVGAPFSLRPLGGTDTTVPGGCCKMKRLIICTLLVASSVVASAQPASSPEPSSRANLYVVEITVGPAWDSSKKPHEQAFFREHSANLKRLRDQGALVLGARYSDKGLVVLQAESEGDAQAMMQQDLSVQNGVFKYELHEFNVFYSGTVSARSRRP